MFYIDNFICNNLVFYLEYGDFIKLGSHKLKLKTFVVPEDYKIIEQLLRHEKNKTYVVKYKEKFLTSDISCTGNWYNFKYEVSASWCNMRYGNGSKIGNLFSNYEDAVEAIINHIEWIKIHNNDYYGD